jgi:hypothetical protein
VVSKYVSETELKDLMDAKIIEQRCTEEWCSNDKEKGDVDLTIIRSSIDQSQQPATTAHTKKVPRM